MHKSVTALALAAAMGASPVVADDLDTVRAYYADILTDPSATTEARYHEIFSPDVVSIPAPPGGGGAQGMLATIGHLGWVVPNLAWEPLEIIETGDGRFVVRGHVTGTPIGPFFPIGPFVGVAPATGRSFEIVFIDIVTVEDGLITHIHPLADWARALAQLTAR